MKLIINADDFGLTSAVSYGIYDAIKNGVVSSTTMMVNQIGTLIAAGMAKKDSQLNVGLHINLSVGSPLTSCLSLVDEYNHFMKPTVLLNDNRYLEDEIYEEMSAQYQKFIDLVGRKPTHLDSHLYLHQIFPKVRNQLIRLSNEHNIPIRELNNNEFSKIEFVRNFKVISNETTENLLSKFKNLIMNYHNYDYVELMVHPGFIDDELMHLSSYNQQRMLEHKILTSQEIKDFIKDYVEIISFKDIPRVNYGKY